MTKRDYFTTTDLLNKYLGFTNYSREESNYPPVNIYAIDEASKDIYIDVAVAGFTKEEIDVLCEDNNLTIKGKHTEDSKMKRDLIYTKRSISSKDFSLSWVVSPKYEVSSASLENGILTVKLSYSNKDSIKRVSID